MIKAGEEITKLPKMKNIDWKKIWIKWLKNIMKN